MVGLAEDITVGAGDPTHSRAAALAVASWAPGDRSRLVRTSPVEVTGRRLVAADAAHWASGAGYL